ncbi:MAG: hypothetical protein IIW72_03060 [Clostridia bacterium]|nr:hypothetical protein [Clostridia bacterium]
MKKIKILKKFIKIAVIVLVCICLFDVVLSGVISVPKEYRNISVSFLTPDLDWCSRPSVVILKYGLPEDVRMLDSATGENDFTYNFTYGDKQVEVFASNRYLPNSCFFNYCFYVDCKTPEEAEKFFNESHKKMLELYGDEEMFTFDDYEPLDLDETDDTKNSCGKKYSIWSGAIGIDFKISYTEDDSIVFITSHCQY